ncbi:MAG: DUF1616 domain-containing protein [Candidatus Thermoplasmatota archaeon]
MKIKIKEKPWDLLIVVLMTTLLILAVALTPESIWRTILGLPFILFLPGYVLISFLFPEDEPLDHIERFALSFGLSIAITPLIGLALNYTWEISLVPILYSQSLFIYTFALLAYLRRRSIPSEELYSIEFEINPPDWENYDWIDKALVIATVGLLIASGTLAYHIATTPRTGERFTEFYVLGPEGEADDYPTNLTTGATGDPGHIILGTINREHRRMDYQLAVRMASTNLDSMEDLGNKIESAEDDEEVDVDVEINFDFENMNITDMPEDHNITLSNSTTYVENFALDHDEKSHRHLNYTIEESGLYFVQFLLVKPDEFSPETQEGYRELHLWVEVWED